MADIIIDVETKVNLRPLGDGLSAATAKASEFEKSINAANARVLAFGASAGLIYKLGEAFNGLVKSTIEVEKSLVDVNTLLNLNQKQIAEFGAELFNVAKGSSQSFEMVSEAAKELARQGLDSEKVLQRTADAMNLAKLSGISASSAVETLTAVLGTFNEQGLNSATIVDRLAAVDAKFAVSSEHLSDALKRSASSAVDANVSFNELIGVVTVVQERTARGGAVIGNAFKSIFTRLGRTEVLDDLANLGIAVKNTEGQILPTVQILKNLSASYAGLAPASKAFISEQVAGVYQIGTLKALMADLSSENSRFAETQIVAANSSGSTSARIKELNTSLDAYLSRLGSAGKQFGAAFGKEGLLSNMKALVGGATGFLEMMTPDPKNSEAIGNKIGVGLMKGLGGFLTGPGLLAVGVIGGKILMKFVSDVAQAASSLASIGKSMSQGELQRQSLEQAIGREIQRQPALLDSVRLGTISIGAAQDQILAKLREEALLRQKILASAMQMAGPLGAAGVLTTDRGAMYTRPPTKAKGFIPNFNYGQEIEDAGASEHGYTAGKAYKTKIHDGRGKSFESFVNDNEDVRTVTNSSGNLATFVTPPNGYGKGTTMAAGGFVPNFAPLSSPLEGYFTQFRTDKGVRTDPRKTPPANYERQLFNGGLQSLGFSDVDDLNSEQNHKLLGRDARADFFARKGGAPYVIDAKSGYEDTKLRSIENKTKSFEALIQEKKYLSYLLGKGVTDISTLKSAIVFGNVNETRKKNVKKMFPSIDFNLGSGFIPNFNFIKGRNTFQTKWIQEQMKKDGVKESDPGFNDYFKSLATKFAVKYPHDQMMMGLSGGFVPNFRNIKYHNNPEPNEKEFKMYSIGDKVVEKEGENAKYQSYLDFSKREFKLKDGSVNKVIELEYIQGKEKGDGFAMFEKLMKLSKRTKRDVVTKWLEPQSERLPELNSSQSNTSKLFKIFPQIRYRDSSKYVSDGYMNGPGDGLGFKFESIQALKSRVEKKKPAAFLESLKKNEITIKDVKTRALNKGFIPNFVDVNYEKSSGSSTKKYTTRSGSYLKFYAKTPGEIGVDFIRSEKSGEGFAMFERLMKLAKRTKRDVVSSNIVSQHDEIPKLDPSLSNTSKLFKIYPQLRYRDVPSKYHSSGIMYARDEPSGYDFSSIEDLKSRVEKKPKDSFLKNLLSVNISHLRTRALSKGFIPNFVDVNYEKSSVSPSKKYTTPSGSYLRFYSKNPGEIDVGFIRSEKSGEGFAMFERLMKLAKRTKRDVVSSNIVSQHDEIPKLDPSLSNTSKLFKIFPQVRYRDVPSKYHTTGVMYAHDEPMGYKFSSIEDLKSRVEKKPKDSFSQNLKSLNISNLRTWALSKGFVPNFANYADSVMGLEENLSGNKATFHTEPFPHVRNSSQPTFSAAMADHGGLSNALKDSMKGQKEAGLMSKGYVPNFAIRDRPVDYTGAPSGPSMSSVPSDQKLEDAARQKLIAEINKVIQEFKKGNINRAELNISTKKLMDEQKVTEKSQKSLNNSINREVNAHNKAAAAAAKEMADYDKTFKGKLDYATGGGLGLFGMGEYAPGGKFGNKKDPSKTPAELAALAAEKIATSEYNSSFKGIVNNVKGVDKQGNALTGVDATNRQLRLGTLSAGAMMLGSQVTQLTAGKGGPLEATGRVMEGATTVASYATMGAAFGVGGIITGAAIGGILALYKAHSDSVAKAAERSKELGDSIRNAGEAMSSLKNNIALLGQASTEAEKKIISQRIVQDKINLNTGIDVAIEKLQKAGYGATEINPDLIKKLTNARDLGESGDVDKGIRLLNEAKAFEEARAAALDEMRKVSPKSETNIRSNIQKALLNSNVDLEKFSPEFTTYKSETDKLEKLREGVRGATSNSGPRSYAKADALIQARNAKEAEVKNLEASINNKVKRLLGSDFTGPANLKLVMDAFMQLGENKANVAATVEKIKIDKEPIEKNIATNKKNVMEAGIKSQKDSTLLNFENTQNLIEREFQLSLRNALGNIDAFSRAFEETANAIKKIEEDANAASIADEFKSFQQAQNGLNEEMKKAKDGIGQIDAGAVIYANFLQGIITNSGTTTDVLNNINDLLDGEYSDDKTLSKSKKEHKVALENIRDNLIKEAAASEDAAKKSQNNIKIEKRKGQNTEELIQAQSKYAGILSEITLSYQDLDFAIKESIKTQDERAGYALEGQRLQRDFSSERMSAMGVTLSPAAAREDAYLESSRRQVEDAQNKIDASQRKAGGSQKSFQEGNLKLNEGYTTEQYKRGLEYLNFEPINKDNVDETITKIKKQLPFYEKDTNQKENLEAMLKSAQAYKADSEATQGLTNTKEGLEASIKVNKEAYDTNTRAFREEANKLEINKMKVENKLAFESSGRKIESEKYLSRFMGPDMAQGENAASKISEDQRLAIQDYNATFDAKNAERDTQINSLEQQAYEASTMYGDEVEKAKLDKRIIDLEAQKVQDGKKRGLEIKKINNTASRDQGSLKETREFDLVESQKALDRNLAKTKRQDASEIYLSQARINSENYLSRDIRSTMGEGGSAAAKIKEDANLQVMQSRAEVALKGTDRQVQIDDLDVRRKALVGNDKKTNAQRADLQDKISKLTKENVADGQMQVANEEKINALMIQRLETLKESRTLGAITNSFFVDLANASDPIANLQRDVKNLAGSMQKGFEDAFVSFVDGTASAGDAFKGFVRSIAKEMAAMSARFTANLITNSLSQLGGTAFQSAQSYFGGSQGGVVRAATGGHITGGSGVRDDIPAILTGGEYVIKKGSVNKYGVDFLEKINAQKFASGGQALSNQYTLGTFSGNYGKGDSETLRGAPTPLLGGVDLNGGSFTMGQYNIDPRLSNMALGDENNPQNRIREDMAELDRERKIAFDDYSMEKRYALEQFQHQKDEAAKAALINAAVQIGMAAISAKINSFAASKQTAGASKDLATFKAETSGAPEAAGPLSASGVRGGELYNQGVTTVTPGEFSFFGKSTPGSYNVGEAKLNPEQFKAYNSQMNMMKTLEASGVQFDKSMSVPENLASRIAAQQVQIDAMKKDSNFWNKMFNRNKKASGGFISDGSGTKDDVPALLMGGEYVISKPAVQKYGVDFMSRVNSGSLTGFARGGSVGDLAPLGSGGSSSTGGNEDLIESINNLSAKIQSQLDKTGGGAGGGAISNNIEININVSESGEVKGSNTSSGDEKAQGGDKKTSEEQKQEENKKRQELAGMLQGMITQTLVKEQRKGGLLDNPKR